MISDDVFQAWLTKGGRRCTLVEIDTDIPRYLSSVAYTTLPTDTPANRPYQPVVAGGIAFSEEIALSGTPSISVGDVELHNEDGALDSWLGDVWASRAMRVYIGDVTWPRDDFKLVFAGVIADADSRTAGRLNLQLRSKLDRLNTPVTEATLGGTSANKDRTLPLLFGEAHNLEPLLADTANLEYMVHNGPVERIIEVRDNGVPVAVTSTLSTGRFRLSKSPAGQITVSAQGATPYTNTAAALIQQLATSYGKASERFTSADLDTASLAAFESANPQPVGIPLGDRSNVLDICQQLAESVGAQVVISRTGLLRLQKIALPPTGTTRVIAMSDYEQGTLEVRERTEVIAGVKLGYAKNWTVQTSLDTGIPAEHKDLFAQEWLTTTVRDTAVATAYRLFAEPEQQDTLLLREVDAQAEASRRLALWSVQRTIYSIQGFAQLLTLELGQSVTLMGSRFGLTGGKVGMVVGLQSDWSAGRMSVEVLV